MNSFVFILPQGVRGPGDIVPQPDPDFRLPVDSQGPSCYHQYMTRLEQLLNHREPIHYPDDIQTLRDSIWELKNHSAGLIQRIYRDWSEDFWCAGWLHLDSDTIAEFAAYLRAEVPEQNEEQP